MERLSLKDVDYAGKTVRSCVRGNGQKAGSVIDIITIATENKNPRRVWADLKKAYPDQFTVADPDGNNNSNEGAIDGDGEESDFFAHKFRGQSALTPMATAKGMVALLMAIPGKNAAVFRQKAMEVVVRYLGGDETLIKEIRANRAVAETNPESVQAFAAAAVEHDRNAGEGDINGALIIEERRLALEERRVRMQLMIKESEYKFRGAEEDLAIRAFERRARDIRQVDDLREYIEGITDARLRQTANDSLNNQLSALINTAPIGISTSVINSQYAITGGEIGDGPPTATTLKTIDQILMSHASNYNDLDLTIKSKIGQQVIKKKGRVGVQKVKKYVNGETRNVNLYPADWENEIMEICKENGALFE